MNIITISWKKSWAIKNMEIMDILKKCGWTVQKEAEPDIRSMNFKKWFATIQKHEGKEAGFDSDCMLFGAEAYTTVRWIGNELGYANEETWSKSKVNYDNNTIDSKKVGAYTVGYEGTGNQWSRYGK